MTPELSSLIKKRQIALKQGNTFNSNTLETELIVKENRVVQSITRKVYNISNSVNHQLGGMKLRNLVEVNLCIKIMKKFLEP